MKLVNNYDDSVEKFRKTVPQYKNYEELLDEVRRELNNE